MCQPPGENGFNWPLLREAVKKPHDNDQLKLCRLILNRASPTTVTNDDEEKILIQILTAGASQVFLLTVNTWTCLTVPSWKRDFLNRVITVWIYKANHLHDLLKSIDNGETPQAGQLSKTLISLPDLVANCYKLSLPKQFCADQYYSRLCVVMVSVCTSISIELRSGINGSTGVLSNLVGRIAFLGHSHQLWSCFLKPLVVQSSDDLIMRRIVLSLMDRQQDIHLDALLTLILSNCDDSSQVDCLLSDSINRKDKVKYLLSQKFVLISYTYSPRLASNLIGYLHKHSPSLLVEVTQTCLDIWSKRSSVDNRTMQQILYIFSLIIFAFQVLSEKTIQQNGEKWFQVVQRGFQVYLEQTTTEIRNCGLYLGKFLLSKIKPNCEMLQIPLEHDANVTFLEYCLSSKSEKLDDAINHELIAEMEKDKPLIEELNPAGHGTATESVHNCDEADEEKEDEDPEIPVRKPKYLNDCIEGLGDAEDLQWAHECLMCCRQLILKNAMSAKESAIYIAQRLVELNNDLNTDEYIDARIGALVALCKVAPKEMSAYLIDRFYDSVLSMATKLDILRILGMAAVQIAFGVHSTCLSLESRRVDGAIEPHKVSMDTIEAIEATWNANDTSQSSRSTRSLGKTRKLTSATKVPVGKVNAFAPYAGHFFYPLITRYNGRDVFLSLDSFDVHLISNLVYTLGVILHASANIWESRRMAKSLLPFIAPLRCHSEPIVRRAVLFAFTNVLTSVPTVYLFQELIEFVQLFKSWLIRVIEDDLNFECRASARTCVYILNDLIDQSKTG